MKARIVSIFIVLLSITNLYADNVIKKDGLCYNYYLKEESYSGKYRYYVAVTFKEFREDWIPSQNIVIPYYINHLGRTYYVRQIDREAFRNCKSLKSITLPSGLEVIGADAFTNCVNLVSVEIPNTVKNIGEFAFAGCKSLQNVTLPNCFLRIWTGAFANCESLTSITIPAKTHTIERNVFLGCSSLKEIIVDKENTRYYSDNGVLYDRNYYRQEGEKIYGRALIHYPAGKEERSFAIPEGVRIITPDAFYKCNNLTSITISQSVTTVEKHAFLWCENLKELHYPHGLNLSNTDVPSKTKLIAYDPKNPPAQTKPSSTITSPAVTQNTTKNTEVAQVEKANPVPSGQQTTTPKQSTSAITTTPTNRPKCAILSPAEGDPYSTPTVKLRYKLIDVPAEGYSVKFYVNGIETTPKNYGFNKGAQIVNGTEVELPMPQETGRKTVVAIQIEDASGIIWDQKRISLNYVNEHKPTLHIFAVGISEYPVSDLLDLKYGAKDAQDFVNTIKSLDLSRYKEVKQTLILDKEANANYVRTQLNKLVNRVDQEDVVMLFFSGHGINEDDKWYFMTYGIPVNDCVNALDFAFIKEQMKKMSKDKNCHVLIFMDACHSGGMYGQKGYVKDITLSEAGINGFYSSAASKKSREENGNGLFTRALIDGIKGAADIDHGGSISISELREYINKTLKDKGQSPVFDNPGGDYVIFYKKK